jgi:hypothetical protein
MVGGSSDVQVPVIPTGPPLAIALLHHVKR